MRINRSLLREGIGIFRLFFGGKKKINKILNKIGDALSIYDAVTVLDDKLDKAYTAGKGVALTANEVVALTSMKNKLKDILD